MRGVYDAKDQKNLLTGVVRAKGCSGTSRSHARGACKRQTDSWMKLEREWRDPLEGLQVNYQCENRAFSATVGTWLNRSYKISNVAVRSKACLRASGHDGVRQQIFVDHS